MQIKDLYENFGAYFDIGNEVRFYLKQGYEVRGNGVDLPKTIDKSKDKRHSEIIMATIFDYRPSTPIDLDIDCKTGNDDNIRIKLSQCGNLEIILD